MAAHGDRGGIAEDSGGLLAPGVMEGFSPPVLMIVGRDTVPIFHAEVRALAQRLAWAEIAVTDAAAQCVPIGRLHEAVAAIRGWMQRIGQMTGETETPRVMRHGASQNRP